MTALVANSRLRPGQLASTLRRTQVDGLGFVDRLKTHYRPYLCPFGELLDLIHDGEHVFDIGCGSGQFALLAASFARPGRISGIEISPRLVANADALFARAAIKIPHAFSVYDGIAFPPALAAADVVFLIDVLHHVPPARQHEFLKDLHRTMRPGARLIVKDIDAASPLVVFNRLHDRVFSGARGHEWPAGKLAGTLHDTGFDVNALHRQTTWVYPHYLCVATKLSAISPSA